MSLIGPVLDDRDFEQLRAELIQRIPTYAPEWTDHNASDPGIALLDLFAFLGESVLFRFNQIPDATKVAFLSLLGVPALPARPAHVLSALRTENPAGVRVPRGGELRAGDVSFETEGEVSVWPVEALGVVKQGVPPAAEDDAAEQARRCDALLRLGLGSGGRVRFFRSRLLPPDPAAPGAEPADVADAVDRALWIAVLHGEGIERDVLARELSGRSLFIGVAFDESVDRPFLLSKLDAAGADRYRSASLDRTVPPTLWRLWSADRTPPLSLAVAGDTTEGLTTTGVVELTLPDPLPLPDPSAPPSGGKDSPPPLDDPGQAARVIAWLQATRPEPAADGAAASGDPIHRVRWVGANAVRAVQARSIVAPELLGTGTGGAGQTYPLVHSGVLARTLVLDVEEAGRWRQWSEVDGFTTSRTGDRHYTVDLAAGEVRFGDGGQGPRVPQLGERIRVRTYRYGGGAAGNVAAGAITQVADATGVDVGNPLPATGGRDAEPLDAALERIPGEVHRRDRAVTADDFRELALRVPGVARAETLRLLHPAVPDVPAAGVVSVLVLPADDIRDPAAPLPDRALLREVTRYLDPRRLITTELYVIPPEYRPIGLAAGIVVRAGFQVDAVRRWVELILRQFLAPLPPFGPEGQGWPLGRTVRRAELEAVAVQVDGVEYLEGLLLAVPDPVAPGGMRAVPVVELARHQLPQVVGLTVVSGAPLAPGSDYRPLPPDAPDVVIAPLPRDVC
ncbi:putative baseplate assembly protein [Streptomyces kanamyceticus]|uniref:Putative baseplate assembly protein n=1 Tax=Streptomyces kanamyceticus TaxID=1967 RepID=A0A5J6GR29_STRKN|nr:putative baseplate assembly protein [Streptomyces kanamyceticus]QEU96631.1 putative baseplate assembly protein [Streptomyces kanamyceticus]